MSKTSLLPFGTAPGLSATAAVQAAEMYPWRDHESPFSFVFGPALMFTSTGHLNIVTKHPGGM